MITRNNRGAVIFFFCGSAPEAIKRGSHAAIIRIELGFGVGSCSRIIEKIIAKKDWGCAKKTSIVCCSDSETCYISVARIRLVKTEKTYRVLVMCKVCR
jgi:hypothetical protein